MTIAAPFQELWQQAGFTAETPIQEAVAEPLRRDENIVGLAPTGSGKTLAFALPILGKIVPGAGLQALLLAPSQELAIQTRDVIMPYAQAVNVRVMGVTGGANVARQKEQLKKHPEVIVATAGRLLELMNANKIKLADLQTIVIDEADELLRDPGLGQVREIASAAPADVQLAFFSATSSPILRELDKWFGQDVKTIDVRAVDKTRGPVKHYFMQGGRGHEVEWLGKLAREDDFRALVFFNKNSTLAKAAGIMRHQHVRFATLERTDRSMARKEALNLLRKGKIDLLLVTDLAGRGLDIPKLPAVVNFEVPRSATVYIHRAGRTGRMGNSGTVITMGDAHDFRNLRRITGDYDVERAYLVAGKLTTERPEFVDEADEHANNKPQKNQSTASAKPHVQKATAPQVQTVAIVADAKPARKPHRKLRKRVQKNKGKHDKK
ncbi:DEAD/DEAH box helicase [Lacticaseibacillus zhaodongensis]|uniref:DEAD/DEAH box helicase n=1 Tax=Lacticaseibacillus zhaodongensis TaxID=2668065 RepID=UPI0012D2E325|nr:DEAD/DEAH box helicase [Lacticaseibacillus zhaodongensis]